MDFIVCWTQCLPGLCCLPTAHLLAFAPPFLCSLLIIIFLSTQSYSRCGCLIIDCFNLLNMSHFSPTSLDCIYIGHSIGVLKVHKTPYTAVYILFLDFILMSNLSYDFHILHIYHLESNLFLKNSCRRRKGTWQES